jgi:predicted aspartyl protease
MIARLSLLTLAMLSAGPAIAACQVQQRAVVTLVTAGALMLAPVTLNGVPGLFILDTGAAQTVVTPDAVDRFNLTLDEWTATTMRGVGGVERRRNADPRTVELGGVALHRRSLARDATLRVASLPRSVMGGQRIDGLLGRDFLSAFDLDLDFSQRKMTLYEVHGCTGRFLPWTSIPVQNPTESAILVQVEVDGVRLHALLDSGASETLVAAPGMARLGLGLDRLRDDPHQIASGVGPHSVTMWRHRFQTFQIGDEAVASSVLLVAPIQLSPTSDMLLGADWLLGRRVWISYSTNQLFVAHGR